VDKFWDALAALTESEPGCWSLLGSFEPIRYRAGTEEWCDLPVVVARFLGHDIRSPIDCVGAWEAMGIPFRDISAVHYASLANTGDQTRDKLLRATGIKKDMLFGHKLPKSVIKE
jgi:hypothetical protein